jgi:hypothetical protein
MKSIARKNPIATKAMDLNGGFDVEFPGGVKLMFFGAPFRQAHLVRASFPTYAVKAATEQRGDFDAEVPCEDFGVPTHDDMRKAVASAIEAAFAGKAVFAGCAGGIGRTGTFLAVVLKTLQAAPASGYSAGWVDLVRQVYMKHAVETPAQRKLIDQIDVSSIQRRVKWLWFKAAVRKFFLGR